MSYDESRKFIQKLQFDNADLMWRNFAGREEEYNAEGDRNFTIRIEDPELAESIREDGWNVRYLDPREDGESGVHYLKVKVSYKFREPRIYLVKPPREEGGEPVLLPLMESTIAMLDYSRFENVDLVVSPSFWSRNGRSGVSAYLESMYVQLETTDIDRKYDGLEIL